VADDWENPVRGPLPIGRLRWYRTPKPEIPVHSAAGTIVKAGFTMGMGEKFDAAKDKIKGKVNKAVGKATDDQSKVAKGHVQEAEGGIKDTVADTKAHLKDDADRRDDTEGGPRA
jgi:uncharacterized protein YjbJ (UPF0337 family)